LVVVVYVLVAWIAPGVAAWVAGPDDRGHLNQ